MSEVEVLRQQKHDLLKRITQLESTITAMYGEACPNWAMDGNPKSMIDNVKCCREKLESDLTAEREKREAMRTGFDELRGVKRNLFIQRDDLLERLRGAEARLPAQKKYTLDAEQREKMAWRERNAAIERAEKVEAKLIVAEKGLEYIQEQRSNVYAGRDRVLSLVMSYELKAERDAAPKVCREYGGHKSGWGEGKKCTFGQHVPGRGDPCEICSCGWEKARKVLGDE